MKIRRTFLGRPTSQLERRALFSFLIAIYVVLNYVATGLLPEKLTIDSARLQDSIGEAGDQLDSFVVSAKVLSIVPENLWPMMLFFLSAVVTFFTARSAKTLGACILATILIPSIYMLVLLVPTKDTIVVAMALIIFTVSRYLGTIPIIATVSVLYVLYGSSIRSYYLLILLTFFGLLVASRLRPIITISFLLVGITSLWLLPPEIFAALQSQRDDSNAYAQWIIHSDNRTAFFNPLPPNSAFNFLVNYAYAAALLNFPLLFGGPFDFVVTCALFGMFNVIRKGMQARSPSFRLPSTLFLAHLIVLLLFEPDVGSYYRHALSVWPLLIPSLSLLSATERKA